MKNRLYVLNYSGRTRSRLGLNLMSFSYSRQTFVLCVFFLLITTTCHEEDMPRLILSHTGSYPKPHTEQIWSGRTNQIAPFPSTLPVRPIKLQGLPARAMMLYQRCLSRDHINEGWHSVAIVGSLNVFSINNQLTICTGDANKCLSKYQVCSVSSAYMTPY